MAFLSELLGRTVADVEGRPIGRLDDLIARHRPEVPLPLITAISVKRRGRTRLVPIQEVAVLVAPAIPLIRREDNLLPYQTGEHDSFLARDILDRQIIDINGVRVVRVNDLEVARVGQQYVVANVDVGGLGLLRRLGLAPFVQRLAGRLGRPLHSTVIAWHEVELLPGDQPIRLRVPGEKIAELHPADLAELIGDLSKPESGRLLAALDVKRLADTLEEVEPEFQASLVQGLSDDRVADVLEEMGPDEAADLLAELPQERRGDLLALMEHEEAEDVRKLLAYAVDTAGGIMTTEYVSVSPDLTAGQVITLLRKIGREVETITYVYAVDQEGRLTGVFSLHELVLAEPSTPIRAFMHTRLVSVRLETPQEEVARVVSKYNLTAVPVCDDAGRIHGIVTADDALDKIIPTAWKQRLPRLYH